MDRRIDQMGWVQRSRHLGVLGTVVEVSSVAADESSHDIANAAVLSEVERLQRVFDVFDERSELRCWERGEVTPSTDLVRVLMLAERWRVRSRGVFDPASASLTRAWDAGTARGAIPTDEELNRIVQTIAALERPAPPAWHPPAVPYSLNAIAKGWIVDRAVEAGWGAADLEAVIVNAGGDLVHWGPSAVRVGIEDPLAPYDNVAPLLTVALQDAALATSGGARRGWQIGETWYSHVLDARTGRPVDHHASVSIVAPDAATADVVATIVAVLRSEEALRFVDNLEEVRCCLVSSSGDVVWSEGSPVLSGGS